MVQQLLQFSNTSPISMVLSPCCLSPVLAVVGETVTVVESVVVDSVLPPEQTNVFREQNGSDFPVVYYR